jgi:hypothetical protein
VLPHSLRGHSGTLAQPSVPFLDYVSKMIRAAERPPNATKLAAVE